MDGWQNKNAMMTMMGILFTMHVISFMVQWDARHTKQRKKEQTHAKRKRDINTRTRKRTLTEVLQCVMSRFR